MSLNLDNIRQLTNLPIVIGFGIKTPQQALEMSNISDGIVIGSAVVEKIKTSLDNNQAVSSSTVFNCLKFISEISNKMRHI